LDVLDALADLQTEFVGELGAFRGVGYALNAFLRASRCGFVRSARSSQLTRIASPNISRLLPLGPIGAEIDVLLGLADYRSEHTARVLHEPILWIDLCDQSERVRDEFQSLENDLIRFVVLPMGGDACDAERLTRWGCKDHIDLTAQEKRGILELLDIRDGRVANIGKARVVVDPHYFVSALYESLGETS